MTGSGQNFKFHACQVKNLTILNNIFCRCTFNGTAHKKGQIYIRLSEAIIITLAHEYGSTGCFAHLIQGANMIAMAMA